MVEYALLVALVALIAIPAVKGLGGGVANQFYDAQREVAGAGQIPGGCDPAVNPDC